MKCLIVGGGTAPSSGLLDEYSINSELIIGVDFGCEILLHSGIIPDYIVGDFDTVNCSVVEVLEAKGAKKIQYSAEKDYSDSKIAFELAVENLATEIFLLGLTGTRFDHTFANVGLLLNGLERNIKPWLIDNNNLITLIDKSKIIKKKKDYKYISFLAYGTKVDRLSISGAKYNLVNYDLELGDGITISNEFITEEIEITFLKGNLLVIYSKD